MDRFDVIVVGAGPAGSAAAYDLADAGLSVALLDRKNFPRVKPCAGAVTVKALKRLRYSIAPVIRWVARDLEVSLGGERERRFASRHPIAAMTVREELDAFCLQMTCARGAQFRVVHDISGLTEDATGVTVLAAAGEALRAAFVIGADGANSRIRRLLGVGGADRAWALEGRAETRSAGGAAEMRFDFACAHGGYGWIFPKGDHVNVGLYTSQPQITFSTSDLVAYARRALGTAQVEEIVGHPLGVGGEAYVPHRRRVILAGDAAGTAERLFGEGIHNAIKSGQLAAEAIVGELRGGREARKTYARGLGPLKADLRTCARMSRRFYRHQRLGFAGLCSLPVRTSLMRGFAAGRTAREILRTAPLAPFYAIDPVESVIQYERDASGRRPPPVAS
jgi:geranylgeranyl reductase family protein